jgi:hypothetical protein
MRKPRHSFRSINCPTAAGMFIGLDEPGPRDARLSGEWSSATMIARLSEGSSFGCVVLRRA